MLNQLKNNVNMKKIMMLLMVLCCLTTVSAQKTVVADKNQKVYEMVEQMPEFPGGTDAMIQYMMESMKYPEDAKSQKLEGRVVVNFVVEPDGSVNEVQVVKPVYASLDQEAVRVVSAMPRWIPGRQKGVAVRVKFTMPVTFRLK